MMSRAIRELKFPPGYISTKSTYSWSISRMQLKEKIMGMKFFADPNLNNKMKEVLAASGLPLISVTGGQDRGPNLLVRE